MTLVQELLKQSKNGKRELARQDLIVSVTEQIWAALEDGNLTKADLARALDTSKSNVTQLLSGNRNMTLATLADIGEAVGVKPRVIFSTGQAALVAQVAAEAWAMVPQAGGRAPVVNAYGDAMEAQAGAATKNSSGGSILNTAGISTFLAEA